MKNHIAAVGLAAIVVASGGLAVAGNSALAAGDSDKAQGRPRPPRPAPRPAGVLKCDGGPNIAMRSRIVDTPFTFVETGDQRRGPGHPGCRGQGQGPQEAATTPCSSPSPPRPGSTAATPTTGWASRSTATAARSSRTATPPTRWPSPACSAWNGNSLQFCTKVGKGKHVLKAYANLYDSGANHSMDGWLDDYTFSVLRFD